MVKLYIYIYIYWIWASVQINMYATVQNKFNILINAVYYILGIFIYNLMKVDKKILSFIL
jgi:hypothetical protein